MEHQLVKHYTNGVITVVWQPGICIHSSICWQQAIGLPEVFNPRARPWVKMDNSTTERIIAQVQQCPSGALRFYYNEEMNKNDSSYPAAVEMKVTKNGPLIVQGRIIIKGIDDNKTTREGSTAFCHCG